MDEDFNMVYSRDWQAGSAAASAGYPARHAGSTKGSSSERPSEQEMISILRQLPEEEIIKILNETQRGV